MRIPHFSSRRITQSFFILGAIATFCVAADSSLVVAASNSTNAQSITMTPSSAQISVAPGGTAKSSFDVVNEGSTDYSITTYAAPYHVEGTNYDPQFTPLPGTTDASKWVHITGATTQALPARQLAAFDYTVTVPQGTAPGGYYAVIFAETAPTTSTTNGVVPHDRVGDIVYITVQGAVKASGNLQVLDIPYLTTSSNLQLGMLVSNTGGVHYLTDATISVKSVFGQVAFRADLQRYVLPQTTRKISATWTHTPPVGLYRIERSATVAGQVRTLPAQWILVIHPWVVVVIAVLALMLSGGIVWKRRMAPNAQVKARG